MAGSEGRREASGRVTVVAGIFARGGSKGVPRKNLRLLGGRPLLAHSVEAARRCRRVSRVIVSTDDPEIADVAVAYGAEVPFMRPSDLASDDAPEWLAWRHLITALQQRGQAIDVLLSVPATAPLRTVDDLEACVDALTEQTDAVLTVTPAHRNPYFNMVQLDPDGCARITMDRGNISRRQAAPPVYDVTTVACAARARYVLTADSIFDGRVRTVTVPRERALDIDTEFDLRIAQCLLDDA